MRLWHRSACLLGNPVVENSIRREMERQFPSAQYPFNIDVVGSQSNTVVTVRFTNFDRAINEMKNALPEDFGLDIRTAVIETAKRVIAELGESGRLEART